MTTLYFRDGREATTDREPDSKGRTLIGVWHNCGRCAGQGGSTHWRPEGGICFQCRGKRGATVTTPIYTAERLAKLNATAEKKAAKKAAKADAERIAEEAKLAEAVAAFEKAHPGLIDALAALAAYNSFLADLHDKVTRWGDLSDKQIAAAKNAIERDKKRDHSQHVGEVGERLEVEVTVERSTGYEGFYGWVSICTFRDAAGNAIVSKGRFEADQGQSLTIRGTIKEHSTYNGERQTIVNRVTELNRAA